ncbi:MAG: hypothetical protein IJ523_01305 [Succinivibrionaceae bacterium]|nr:hypothetical protein [Succinivibrionaceae bacterium]
MIVNAHCHRDFADNSSVQVTVYDDRVEVISPGGLYNKLTMEEVMKGISRFRNPAIANVFCKMGLSEAWGTGLRRIRFLAKNFGLPAPQFEEAPTLFRVSLYRKPLWPDYPANYGLPTNGAVPIAVSQRS